MGSIVFHGGTPALRQQIAQRVVSQLPLRPRYSSRAAEAAKCMRDETVVAVVLIDAPRDGAAVRALAESLTVVPIVWHYVAADEATFVTSVAARVVSGNGGKRIGDATAERQQ
jgi:hypothetical protein